MTGITGIGYQNFEEIVKGNIFYIDKTLFIKEWWENADKVTLITRPRRFGKTLNISMTEQFFRWIIRDVRIFLKILRYGKRKSIGNCKAHFR